ncbi:hypothetical protein [Piscirickettsia litoralis]|uniref:Uncharacterized protein n=1 Tax=Piscirickettsia litoralis TaxID=1891921 RepID=A0ABX3A1G9_9GAMM|nr:hypothetical protein [Piscirickettsia litoralis]ODN42288.1 hypothetical protein BGC07_04255 [Piscirickettsia litoralis]
MPKSMIGFASGAVAGFYATLPATLVTHNLKSLPGPFQTPKNIYKAVVESLHYGVLSSKGGYNHGIFTGVLYGFYSLKDVCTQFFESDLTMERKDYLARVVAEGIKGAYHFAEDEKGFSPIKFIEELRDFFLLNTLGGHIANALDEYGIDLPNSFSKNERDYLRELLTNWLESRACEQERAKPDNPHLFLEYHISGKFQNKESSLECKQ